MIAVDSETPTVQVRPAAVFTCPDCELETWMNVNEDGSMPNIVTCDLCNKQYSNEEGHPQ